LSGSRFLQPKRSRFLRYEVATEPPPVWRFDVMPVRSRFFAPPAAPLPPPALNSRFISETPAPASQFLPPSPESRFIPPPAARLITATKRRLHALWKAKNFRKPFT